MPLDSSRENVIKDKRKSHGFTPYDQAGRRAKMVRATLGSWRPSIWNALTFWKSSGSSSDQEEENRRQDASDISFGGPSSPTNSSALNGTNDSPNGSTDSQNNGERHANDSSFTSDLSEAQVSSLLTLQPSRHVHFKLPLSDQERLNSGNLQIGQVNKKSATEPSSRQNHSDDYVAPIPPSSPLHRLATSQQDPLIQVAEYIANRDGRRPLNHVEALGLNSLIQQSVYVPGLPTMARFHEQQRPDFIPATSDLIPSSISPSPPIRPTFTNASTDIAALFTSSSTPSASDLPPTRLADQVTSTRSSASPSRTLARNPNGTLYYEGGGSARAQYRSSTFGASPTRKKVAFPRGFGDSPSSNGSTLSSETPSPSDGKRRRIGEDRHSSTAQASGLVPAMVNGSAGANKTLITQPMPASASIRGLGTPSPTSRLFANTPARPSPLRQSVRADSSSPSSASPGSGNEVSPRIRINAAESPSRIKASEKASEIMAGIISDATPKKDRDHLSDLRNPYQTDSRSPTRRNRKLAMKAPRPPPRPLRSTGPPPTPQPKKLSALETIQRTAPQAQTGSKRSRAGTSPLDPKASSVNGISAPPSVARKTSSSAEAPVVIEIDEDSEDDQTKYPPLKKQRQDSPEEAAGKENEFSEVDDVVMDGPDSSSAAEKVVQPSEVLEHDAERPNLLENKLPVFAPSFGKKTPMTRFQSVPKEPSPLRQSFQPDVLSSPPADVSSPTSSVPKESPFAPTSISTSTFPSTSTSAFAPTSASSSLTQGFTPNFSSPVPSVPTQNTTTAPSPVTNFPPTFSPCTDWLAAAKDQVLNMPADALPTFGFPLTSSTVVLSTYESQREVALAVPSQELPKFDFTLVAVPKVEIRAFDFKAAGMKPLVKSGWTCATCLITNNNDATKCVSCESTR